MTNKKQSWTPLPFDDRYELHPRGEIRKAATKRLRKLSQKQNGYLGIVFTYRDRPPKGYDFHSLMVLTFLGQRPPGCDVSHIDGDRLNNNLKNLCYESRSANMNRSLPALRGKRGKQMSRKRVLAIRQAKGALGEIAQRFRISKTQVWRIKHGISWRKVHP